MNVRSVVCEGKMRHNHNKPYTCITHPQFKYFNVHTAKELHVFAVLLTLIICFHAHDITDTTLVMNFIKIIFYRALVYLLDFVLMFMNNRLSHTS